MALRQTMHRKRKERACLMAENGGFFELSMAMALSWLRSTTHLFVLVSSVGTHCEAAARFSRPS
jgi:hypothetical protein